MATTVFYIVCCYLSVSEFGLKRGALLMLIVWLVMPYHVQKR